MSKREEFLAKAEAEMLRAEEGLIPFYVGRNCPVKGDANLAYECIGPRCAWWMNSQELVDGKVRVTGGGCAVPLLASQAGPIAAGLERAAEAMFQKSGEQTTRVVVAPK